MLPTGPRLIDIRAITEWGLLLSARSGAAFGGAPHLSSCKSSRASSSSLLFSPSRVPLHPRWHCSLSRHCFAQFRGKIPAAPSSVGCKNTLLASQFKHLLSRYRASIRNPKYSAALKLPFSLSHLQGHLYNSFFSSKRHTDAALASSTSTYRCVTPMKPYRAPKYLPSQYTYR